MYTSLKKPRLGDRVRLTGFLGVFEVVRVRPDGSLVDLKHLDLHATAYIEREVSAHDLIYVQGPQAADPCLRPAATNAATQSSTAAQPIQHRSAAAAGYPLRVSQRPPASAPSPAAQAARRRES